MSAEDGHEEEPKEDEEEDDKNMSVMDRARHLNKIQSESDLNQTKMMSQISRNKDEVRHNVTVC